METGDWIDKINCRQAGNKKYGYLDVNPLGTTLQLRDYRREYVKRRRSLDNIALQGLLDLTTTGYGICTQARIKIISMYHNQPEFNAT